MLYLAIASYSGVAGIGWPMEVVIVGGRTMYRPSRNVTCAGSVFLHIVNSAYWSAFTFDWWGPLRIKVETGHQLSTAALVASPEGRREEGTWNHWRLGGGGEALGMMRAPIDQSGDTIQAASEGWKLASSEDNPCPSSSAPFSGASPT